VTSLQQRHSRQWIATAIVILVVAATWKFIDYRMQPPPVVAKPVTSDM
jgi:hypothetical protein